MLIGPRWPHRRKRVTISQSTPELDAARAAGDQLLVAQLIALYGTEAKAETELRDTRHLVVQVGDFCPTLPTNERNGAARRSAMVILIATREAGGTR